MEFWNRVKSSILKNEIKQEWVAKQAGMDFSAFRSTVSRKHEPSVSRAYLIARALGVSMEWLVDGEDGAEYVRQLVAKEGTLYRPPPRLAAAVAALDRLDDSRLETARVILEAMAGEVPEIKAQGS